MSLSPYPDFIRVPSSPPSISAVLDFPGRPLWSVMIPTYNCSELLKEAILSVLAQDPGLDMMQIEVIDDASTDADVALMVAEIGVGRVQYFRQERNVGSVRNFETCINRSQGRLVHLLHGNDRTVEGFYKKIENLFYRYPESGAAFSHYAPIDDKGVTLLNYAPSPVAVTEGVLPNWLLRIAEYQRMQYVSVVVRREVYEKLGSFYGTTYGEDWEMWVRIAAHYPVAYTPEVLAEYRGHTNSISWQKARSGQILPDLIEVMMRIQQHVPVDHRESILALSKRYYAQMGIGTAYQVLSETQDWSLAIKQVKQALALSRHPSIYYQVLKFYLKFILKFKM